MPVLYLDPFKDDPYAKLRGEKNNEYFTIAFDEAKVYPVDNGYYLAAWVTMYQGVIRSFKPENPILAGLCAIPIYNSEYEIRQKVNGEYQTTKHQPSIFENQLCKEIKDKESEWIGDNVVLKGSITHVPDAMLKSLDVLDLATTCNQNAKLEVTPSTGKLPEYKPPTNYSQRKGGGNYFKGASVEDKLNTVKKEIAEYINDPAFTADTNLGTLVEGLYVQHSENTEFMTFFLDLLAATVK